MSVPEIEVRRVRESSPLSRLDGILVSARRELVRRGEHLASMKERLEEAEADERRILLYARIDRRAVGVIDALLHAPGPGDLTIAQIAVAPDVRTRGIGRTLFRKTLHIAEKRLRKIDGVVVSVHPDNAGAIAFWECMGLSASLDDRGSTVLLTAAATVVSCALDRR